MNKTLFVTGACRNTGVDIVKKFASEGWNVAFTSRNLEEALSKEKEYKNEFPNVEFLGAQLNSIDDNNEVKKDDICALFSQINDKFGKIDALVFNAADLGINQDVHIKDLERFEQVIKTNVCWNYAMVQEALQYFPKEGASIVFVNSNTAYRAIPNRVAYCASKGAQLGMMRALALDLGKDHIRVNAVLPGMIITDRYYANREAYDSVPSRFTPLGEIATGKDVAEAVYYLTCNANNTTGAELTVDGGNMIQLYPIINK